MSERDEAAIGVHVAGRVLLIDGLPEQRCARCGDVLRRIQSSDVREDHITAYHEGSLIERGRGWQAILIRVGAVATCQPRAQQRSA